LEEFILRFLILISNFVIIRRGHLLGVSCFYLEGGAGWKRCACFTFFPLILPFVRFYLALVDEKVVCGVLLLVDPIFVTLFV